MTFYTPGEIQLRQAVFFTGASLSGAFSGLLAAAISKMDGIRGLGGWRDLRARLLQRDQRVLDLVLLADHRQDEQLHDGPCDAHVVSAVCRVVCVLHMHRIRVCCAS